MKYVVEFHKEGHEDSFLRLEAETPFPEVGVGERVEILSGQAEQQGWRVQIRSFIFSETRCTVEYWCAPEEKLEAPPKRKAITSIADLRVTGAPSLGTKKAFRR